MYFIAKLRLTLYYFAEERNLSTHTILFTFLYYTTLLKRRLFFVYHAITKMKRKKVYNEVKFKQKSRMTLSSPPRSEKTCSTAKIPFIHCGYCSMKRKYFLMPK